MDPARIGFMSDYLLLITQDKKGFINETNETIVPLLRGADSTATVKMVADPIIAFLNSSENADKLTNLASADLLRNNGQQEGTLCAALKSLEDVFEASNEESAKKVSSLIHDILIRASTPHQNQNVFASTESTSTNASNTDDSSAFDFIPDEILNIILSKLDDVEEVGDKTTISKRFQRLGHEVNLEQIFGNSVVKKIKSPADVKKYMDTHPDEKEVIINKIINQQEIINEDLNRVQQACQLQNLGFTSLESIKNYFGDRLGEILNLSLLNLQKYTDDEILEIIPKLPNLTFFSAKITNPDKLKEVSNQLIALSYLELLILEAPINEESSDGLKNIKSQFVLMVPDSCQITNKILVNLAACQSLYGLSLSNCSAVTDEGFEELGKLVNLSTLHCFSFPAITDRGIESLVKLENLMELGLNNCPRITSDGLVHLLTKLKKLLNLDLQYSTITNEGVGSLAELEHLEELNLTNCQNLGPALLQFLPKLKNLKVLRIRGAEDKVKDLIQNAVPNVKIITTPKM
jgi:hypothetical protein